MIDAIEGMVSQRIHPKEVAKAVVYAINNLKPKLDTLWEKMHRNLSRLAAIWLKKTPIE
jgi:hypothetical protein